MSKERSDINVVSDVELFKIFESLNKLKTEAGDLRFKVDDTVSFTKSKPELAEFSDLISQLSQAIVELEGKVDITIDHANQVKKDVEIANAEWQEFLIGRVAQESIEDIL